MAFSLFKIAVRFRFLLVAALTMAVLSTPLLTDAGTKTSSSVSLTEVPSVVAGMSSEVKVQAGPLENMEIALQKPDGNTLILQTITNEQGEALLTLSDYHLRQAGTYEVKARSLEENGAATRNFEVYAGTVSTSKSTAVLSKNSAQVGETVEMKVSLMDSYGNAIKGHVLELVPGSTAVSSYSQAFSTDEKGHMEFFITSKKKGIYEFTILDSTINKALTTHPKLAFAGTQTFAEVGGHDDVYLTAASGSVDSFEITGLSSSTLAGKNTTVTVKAVDEEGFTVSDYTGTIRFSSTDSEATLPSDYTFLAEDQGEHSFSLAIKMVTPGEQTLTVTDVDEISLNGETETTVVTSSESSSDYDSDFETTDFTREGDFSLISPASGSYSSNTVEVQGEAEYGYTAFIRLDDNVVGHTDVEFDNSFSFRVEELEDGTYELYVEIVDVNLENPEDYTDEEIDEIYEQEEEPDSFELIESSDSERIVVDTTAPELVDISTNAEDETALTGGESLTITVLSESDLEEASLIFNEEVYLLNETSTSGKYQASVPLPTVEGTYPVDVILLDKLGNEVKYNDQLDLTVGTGDSEPTDEPSEETAPEAVSGLSATAAEEKILLSWEEPESSNSIAYYRVYYGPSKDALYAVSETYDSSTNWSILSLDAQKAYYFAVAAVDIEGMEGEKSNTVQGVPLLSSVAPVDEIDDTSEVPAISGSEDDIEETPESGPAQTALLVISAIGGLGYWSVRKRASARSL